MTKVRTAWISDVHLGSRSCQAASLLRFLDQVECEKLYLIGDIVDVIALKRSVHWPDLHTQVLRKFIEMRRAGVEVTYIPGNHDDQFRTFAGSAFDDIKIRRRVVHKTSKGKRLLLTHGDEMDARMRCGTWLRHVGSVSYCVVMAANRNLNRLRNLFGLPYYSLAAQVKRRVGKAMAFIDSFEQGMAEVAREAGLDGVVCGHIHHAALKEIDGIIYGNDGDWVESLHCAGRTAQR